MRVAGPWSVFQRGRYGRQQAFNVGSIMIDAEAETQPAFEAVLKRFTGRPPLVEIKDLRAGDFRLNRTAHPQGLRAATVYILTWDGDKDRLLKTNVPLWLMKFSSINILSHLGIAPEKFRLTAEDLARYGPGIVVDYRKTGSTRVLIWVE